MTLPQVQINMTLPMILIPHMSKQDLNFGCYGEVTYQLFFPHIPKDNSVQ